MICFSFLLSFFVLSVSFLRIPNWKIRRPAYTRLACFAVVSRPLQSPPRPVTSIYRTTNPSKKNYWSNHNSLKEKNILIEPQDLSAQACRPTGQHLHASDLLPSIGWLGSVNLYSPTNRVTRLFMFLNFKPLLKTPWLSLMVYRPGLSSIIGPLGIEHYVSRCYSVWSICTLAQCECLYAGFRTPKVCRWASCLYGFVTNSSLHGLCSGSFSMVNCQYTSQAQIA